MPYAKNKFKVNVPHRSGFDKTHRNSGTLTCGSITPVLCDELIPGSRVSLKLNLATQMPPLASDTYMNCKMRAEAFFVPSRLLCSSFEDWFCDDLPVEIYDGNYGTINAIPRLPYFTPADLTKLGPGSLADYLGIKVTSSGSDSFSFNALPFLAYHLVWQEWYRNPRVQKPAFLRSTGFMGSSISPDAHLKTAPSCYFQSASASTSDECLPDLATAYLMADGHDVFALRQRNFGLDYFTGSRVSAQQGTAVSLNIPATDTAIDVIDSDGNPVEVAEHNTVKTGFTIAALRAANSLQQFRERNNLPSPRLVDQVKARYGAILSDGVAQRPICIGTASYEVNSTGISQTGDVTNPSTQPFDSVGAQYGRAYSAGSDFIIDDFTANEPGYLLVNLTLVPEVTYASGVDKMFLRYLTEGSIAEMANPLLQNVGDEPIFDIEISTAGSGANYSHVLGYQDRFGSFMYKPNSAHGLFRDGQSLAAYVLQRSFSGSSPISQSSALLTIPKNYLDPVLAVSTQVSGVSAWYDCMLQYKVSMPLAEFSIPSLQDPAYEHGKPIVLHRNGQIF